MVEKKCQVGVDENHDACIMGVSCRWAANPAIVSWFFPVLLAAPGLASNTFMHHIPHFMCTHQVPGCEADLSKASKYHR